jgi:inward rectifier potassium channel
MVSMIVTLTGFDGTYAQTIHARHMYRPSHVLFARRFVDVVSTLEDGRLLVDYERFHETEPDEGAIEAA